MYSLVLMMAMTGSGDVPAFGARNGGCCGGCVGCTGCRGGCAGCTGCKGGCGGAMPKAEPIGPPKAPGAAMAPAPATLVVSLPDDAKLTINNVSTTSTTARRVFVSPPLAPGKDFYYQLRAEVVRDGQKVAITKQVVVRGGQESQVQLEMPAAITAAQ